MLEVHSSAPGSSQWETFVCSCPHQCVGDSRMPLCWVPTWELCKWQQYQNYLDTQSCEETFESGRELGILVPLSWAKLLSDGEMALGAPSLCALCGCCCRAVACAKAAEDLVPSARATVLPMGWKTKPSNNKKPPPYQIVRDGNWKAASYLKTKLKYIFELRCTY